MIALKTFHRSTRLAEIRVSYRRRKPPVATGAAAPVLNTARLAETYLRSIWSKGTLELVEDFVLVCLNTALEPLGWVRISRGGRDGTSVDPRIVFAIALQTASASILVAHNHPSGTLQPSSYDIALTKRLKEAGELLHCRLLDHIILTRDSAVSLSEKGLL